MYHTPGVSFQCTKWQWNLNQKFTCCCKKVQTQKACIHLNDSPGKGTSTSSPSLKLIFCLLFLMTAEIQSYQGDYDRIGQKLSSTIARSTGSILCSSSTWNKVIKLRLLWKGQNHTYQSKWLQATISNGKIYVCGHVFKNYFIYSMT